MTNTEKEDLGKMLVVIRTTTHLVTTHLVTTHLVTTHLVTTHLVITHSVAICSVTIHFNKTISPTHKTTRFHNSPTQKDFNFQNLVMTWLKKNSLWTFYVKLREFWLLSYLSHYFYFARWWQFSFLLKPAFFHLDRCTVIFCCLLQHFVCVHWLFTSAFTFIFVVCCTAKKNS